MQPGRHFTDRVQAGHIGGVWTNLGKAAGTQTVGLNRVQVDPGKWSTPFHRQTAEEEIFFVLSGRPVLRTPDGEEELAPGDFVSCRRGGRACTRSAIPRRSLLESLR